MYNVHSKFKKKTREDNTGCPKNNDGVSERSSSKYTKGIRMNVVPLYSSTQTAS
jgi:hypothetical protein